ncbi:unnamed protein product [Lecanosticta acicola]|uniref:Unnamed protein product n=1 Tax=Lecanosticta acicola TaxID=111012 RepID=A0AAI8VUR7_9PEZI|nr:unnamed protein product [Lecanosticta acicola]
MPPQSIIDGHIHLWPESMSNEEGHTWMTPGMLLAKQHILSDYCKASRQEGPSAAEDDVVEGVVYVETDVRYAEPASGDLSTWAKGPLDEIKFLRQIVESEYGERDSRMLLGIVAWAPLNQRTKVLEEWLRLAEETAGLEAWGRFKGFRFLLQAIHDEKEFEALVFSADFIENLKLLGRKGFSFDVGVDQHSGGIWQLEAINKAMKMAHQNVTEDEKVVFILNHLCKPDFRRESKSFFEWRKAITEASRLSGTYMKLSGAFSELPDGVQRTGEIVGLIKPWVKHVLESFGAKRVMFGSDWPVCNVKGPTGEDSWVSWREVVETLLSDMDLGLSGQDMQRIWRDTAKEAYRID